MQRAVHHDRPPLAAVAVGEPHVEPFRQIEVELDGRHLPQAAERVAHMQVDLGAVKRAAALVHLVGQLVRLDGAAQRRGGALPTGVVADRLLRARGQVGDEVGKAVRVPQRKRKAQCLADLVLDLIGGTEQVCVILRQAAYAQRAVQCARALEPVHRAELRPAQRQVAIGTDGALVDHDVERTVHRFQVVPVVVQLHGREHVVRVEVEMPRRPPQPLAADVRGIDQFVAAREVLLLPEVLDDRAQPRALRVPENQPRSHLLLNREQVQLAPDPAMVAPLDFRQPFQVGGQLLLAVPRRAVDALQHGAPFIAAPIRAGAAGELERRRIELPGAVHVRTAAQICERVLREQGELLVLRQVADQLQLVRLFGKPLQGGVAVDHAAQEPMIAGRNAPHTAFDLLEIVGRQGPGQIEVVVEPVGDRRADSQLRIREQLQNCLRHDMGKGMADPIQMVGAAAFRFGHAARPG